MHDSLALHSVGYFAAALVMVEYLVQLGETKLQRSQIEMSIFDFDVHDILNERLIPVKLMSQQMQLVLGNGSVPQAWLALRMGDAVNSSDLNAAFVAMKYHRRMINEFMATDYVARQILSARPVSQWNEDPINIGKRMGAAPNTSSELTLDRQFRAHSESTNHKLLGDEGMTRYKSWLEKTITLEDIQRQLEEKRAVKKYRPPAYQRRQWSAAEPLVDEKEDDEADFEDGDLTGYALTTTPNDYFQSQSTINHQYWPYSMPLPSQKIKSEQSINKNGYDIGYEDYGAHQAQAYGHAAPAHSLQTESPKPNNKEISLKDITDIALTTLAFLSFGMFILQVLMCITMGKDDASSMMMLPMEATDAPDLPGDGTEEIRRKRRSTASQRNRRLIMMNEIARRVLFSIDAVLDFQLDDGHCHRWSLCENNRFAKKQETGQKLWIPIWRNELAYNSGGKSDNDEQ